MFVGAPENEPTARYVNALENLFVQIRGRGVQWSADDRERAQRWQQMGVSLPRIVAAIQTRAKAYRFLHGNAADLPIRLRFYESAVLGTDALKRIAANMPAPTAPSIGLGPATLSLATTNPGSARQIRDVEVERDGSDSPATKVFDLLDHLPTLALESEDPAVREAYLRAGRSLARSLTGKTRDTADGIDGPGAVAAIERARRVLRKTMLEGIGEAARGGLEADVHTELSRGMMSASARKKRRLVLVDRELGRRFGVQFPHEDGWRQQ